VYRVLIRPDISSIVFEDQRKRQATALPAFQDEKEADYLVV